MESSLNAYALPRGRAGGAGMRGIDPDSIDLVERNNRTDNWSLLLIHTAEWDGSDEQLDRFERKLERYREFAVDGEMFRLYPESKARPVSIEIHLYTEPRPAALAVIQHVRERLVPYDIPVIVQRMNRGSAQARASRS
jgi:hypothetical protein